MAIGRQSLGANFYWRNRALKTLGHAVLIITIAILFLYRASDTFVSDHSFGDQRAYLGIAMKLEQFGFRAYNLDHIDAIHSDGGVEYVYSPVKDGGLLGAFRSEGLGFFGQPFYHTPPLFPYLLSFSHRVFSPHEGYRLLWPATAKGMSFKQLLKVQFYSSVVPLIFGLAVVVATFLLGRMLFDYWTGIIAMLLVAVSPVNILASEMLWQDTLLAALIALTTLLLVCYFRSSNVIYFMLSVISYALALLTKNTAILLLPTLLVMAFSYRRGESIKKAVLSSGLKIGIFFLLVFVLTFPWYYTAYETWGTPFYNAGQEGISKIHPWYIFNKTRPWYSYLVSIPSMMPLYLLGYYRIIKLVRRKVSSNEVFLVVWFLSFFVSLTLLTHFSELLGPDSRYMLPAYPPLAILTGFQILRLKDWLALRLPAQAARFAVIISLIICSVWSYSLSTPAYYKTIYENFMNMPF